MKEPPIITYTVPALIDETLGKLRRALAADNLRTAVDLDISAHLKRELGVVLRESRVLYVDDPVLLLESMVLERGAALFVPVPVALCGREWSTRILLRSRESLGGSGLPAGVAEPLLTLHGRIERALEKVGEREGVLAHVG